MKNPSVLFPAVAGRWYPAGRDELGALVDRLLDDAARRTSGGTEPAALIAPHAGYTYSGAVAAAAFKTVAGSKPRRIVILGPSHHFGFAGAAVPDAAEVLRTPLGDVPLDLAALETLRACKVVRADDRVFAPEHSLEAEVPFLQRAIGNDTPIVPILIGGGCTRDEALDLARSLAPLAGPETLVVVSSDFTHYGPRFGYVPFESDVPEKLRKLDLSAIATISAGDGTAFARYVDRTGATICGRRAIDVALALPFARAGGELLEYDASGRMTGDWGNSVSYASIRLHAPPAAA